jgi:EAL domain-containing protein (putative c-di-GMP-specific phosphodiesterase class I)
LSSKFAAPWRAARSSPGLQPIFNLDTGRVVGYEALARWQHPSRGQIPPDVFIPIAEQSDAILEINETILEKSCRTASLWPQDASIAVNLSTVQFNRSELLVAKVKAILERTGFDPRRLYLEITESMLMEDTPRTRSAIAELVALAEGGRARVAAS